MVDLLPAALIEQLDRAERCCEEDAQDERVLDEHRAALATTSDPCQRLAQVV